MLRIVILCFVLLSSITSMAGYELRFGNDSCLPPPQLRLVPISGGGFAVSYAGVHMCRLMTVSTDTNRLVSTVNSEYSAVVTNGTVVVNSKNFLEKGPAVMVFKNGRLLLFRRTTADGDGKEDLKFLTTSPFKKSSIAQLWRPKKNADDIAWKYWNQSGRLRLWYFNPNAAGTLFAELSLVFFALNFLFRRKVVRIVGTLGGIIFAVLLFFTQSRGSLLAFLVGIAALIVPKLYGRLTKRSVFWAIGVVVSVFVLMASGLLGDRFGSKMFAVDQGNVQRLRCWSVAPRMMADAPGGWGNDCGHAYCDWYQAVDDTHSLRWLVNTHLTWMVENGRVFGYCYVFAWLLGGFLLLRCRRSKCASCAISEWLLLFVSFWFSTIGIFASLWILPVSLSLYVLLECRTEILKAHSYFRITFIPVIIMLLSVVMVESMCFVGRRLIPSKSKIEVSRREGRTIIGKGTDNLTILHDGYVLTNWRNGVLGREVRAFLGENPHFQISVIDSIEDLPTSTERLVLVGKSGADFLRYYLKKGKNVSLRFGKLFFVSPPFPPDAIPRRIFRETEVAVLYGEYAAALLPEKEELPTWVTVVSGAELYIPNWLSIVSKK